jgi:hypothetical protein
MAKSKPTTNSSEWKTPQAISRDPHEAGADGYSQFSNWSGYTEHQPGSTQSGDSGVPRPFPSVPKSQATEPWADQSDDAINANDPNRGQIGDQDNLITFTGEDGGAPEWKSYPRKENSFTIDSNSLKWPDTEAAKIAKR